MCQARATAQPDDLCPNHRDPHNVCNTTTTQLQHEVGEAWVEAGRCHNANQLIARHIRGITAPGVKRKTIRLDDLRDIIRRADQWEPK